MIIALTGTPGTGKTTTAGRIHGQYRDRYRIIDLNRLVLDEGLHSGKDAVRDSYLVDMEKLEERIQQIITQSSKGMDIILEGHLSHLLPADAVIVLRAKPDVLRERLMRKEYSPQKIQENSDAEALDVILIESVERCQKVFEVDTTDRDPQDVAVSVLSIIESLKMGETPEEFLPGKIDWLGHVGENYHVSQ